MFNQIGAPKMSDTKLAVLEEKLNIYEELSREMLSKLESAVNKISESNQRIANILAKHDERIDQSIKTDQVIIKMIEDVKASNTVEHQSVIKRIETVEETVRGLSQTKWMLVGMGILSGVVATIISTILSGWMSAQDYSPRIQENIILEQPQNK
jgi:transcriptional regulator GlxA family with amidase domain